MNNSERLQFLGEYSDKLPHKNKQKNSPAQTTESISCHRYEKHCYPPPSKAEGRVFIKFLCGLIEFYAIDYI